MVGADERLSGLAAGHGGVLVLAVAFLLGLRHASDPDHLVAVSTLVADTRERAARAAAALGAAWGAGHAATMLAFGLPVLLVQAYLPAVVGRAAEVLIGGIIVALAVRLLAAWRRGAFHLHVHEHAGSRHAHVHSHAHDAAHGHRHPVRTPARAFSVGLVHGLAGSAGVTVLLVAAVPGRTLAAAALVVLVAGCALSMTLLSACIARVLALAAARRVLTAAIPALGSLACLFGAWYAVDAVRAF